MDVYKIIPEFPRTPHLTAENYREVELAQHVHVTEKVDGSGCAMAMYDGHPLIRSRKHILKKGHLGKTAAKKQFASIFNWWHKNKDCFERLQDVAGCVSVYGEWMYAQHGMEYDRLPDTFLAFDLYDYVAGKYIDPLEAYIYLRASGFLTVPELYSGKVADVDELGKYFGTSELTTKAAREGMYIRVSDGKYVTYRCKLVREDFKQGELWNEKVITRNTVMHNIGL